MGLNCREMVGVSYKCPNISTCMENSCKPSMAKTLFFVLNQQMCQLEDIKVNDRSLDELLTETNQDIESLMSNVDSFAIAQRTRD
ncbi:hypothetical protein NUACC26_014170 [Scytonema sp. NUACC26]